MQASSAYHNHRYAIHTTLPAPPGRGRVAATGYQQPPPHSRFPVDGRAHTPLSPRGGLQQTARQRRADTHSREPPACAQEACRRLLPSPACRRLPHSLTSHIDFSLCRRCSRRLRRSWRCFATHSPVLSSLRLPCTLQLKTQLGAWSAGPAHWTAAAQRGSYGLGLPPAAGALA
jgi:hypothetical protein